jgi:hyaluronoglucosaminidase
MPPLGIIEGYFGRAWSWPDRTHVMRTLAAHGYGFFHYAPKIDPCLRRQWQQLHRGAQRAELMRFAAHCKAVGVRFGMGLTPYDAHLQWTRETRAALAAKVKDLVALGIDDLVILFDDMRGDLPDLARLQADIFKLCQETAGASRAFTCPSYYSDDPVLDRVFGARPVDYLHDFGRLIDPAVHIYWTGEEVCSAQISPGHLQRVAEVLGRAPALWDNYPVNDGPRMSQYLHLRAFTGRDTRIAPLLSAHAINPASQPHLGLIPALTLPMAYAQGDDYCYGRAFTHSAERCVGSELAAALHADLLTLQQVGLDRLGERAASLRARYAGFSHPAAQEVVDWLDGGYAITGEMLQTQ